MKGLLIKLQASISETRKPQLLLLPGLKKHGGGRSSNLTRVTTANAAVVCYIGRLKQADLDTAGNKSGRNKNPPILFSYSPPISC